MKSPAPNESQAWYCGLSLQTRKVMRSAASASDQLAIRLLVAGHFRGGGFQLHVHVRIERTLRHGFANFPEGH